MLASTQSGGMPMVAPSNTVSSTVKGKEKVTSEITTDLEESSNVVTDNG